MLIDTHCHLFNEYYNDINDIINNATINGVEKFIVSGCDYNSNLEVLNLVKKYPNIYGTLGLHPENCNENIDKTLKLIEKEASNPKIVAIGEIGLDFYYGKDTEDIQIEILEKQLRLAEKLRMPVVIHSREATKKTIDALKKYNVSGIIHCFNGSYDTAQEYIKMGFKLGVNGIITFKNCNLKDTIRLLKVSDLVLETDSPFLTPEPYRKYKNEPKYINNIAEFLAVLFDVSLDNVAKITSNNVKDIFDIDVTI